MKISLFGKSGPSVVSFGLVCARDSPQPDPAATIASSPTNTARNVPDILVSRQVRLRHPIMAPRLVAPQTAISPGATRPMPCARDNRYVNNAAPSAAFTFTDQPEL